MRIDMSTDYPQKATMAKTKGDKAFLQIVVSPDQLAAFKRCADWSGIEQTATWARARLIEAAVREFSAAGEPPTFLASRSKPDDAE